MSCEGGYTRLHIHLVFEFLTVGNVNFLDPNILAAVCQKKGAELLSLLLFDKDNKVLIIEF